MRHGDKVNNLGRKTAHRHALLSNLACALIRHKRINTTLAKAKALRVYVEPLLTKSKSDNTSSRRVVFGYLQDKEAVGILFRDIAAKIAERPGGYTRILKTGIRKGDNSEMCFIELVDFNEAMLGTKSAPKAKTTRRGRKKSGSTQKSDSNPAEAKDSPAAETGDAEKSE